jgi:hypothetical protein
MEKCLWLKLRLVATIEYLEWTAANHLRLARFRGYVRSQAITNYSIRESLLGISPRSACNSGTFLAQQVLRRNSGIFAEAR